MLEDNIALVHTFFDILNAHDLDALDRMRDEDFVNTTATGATNVTPQIHRFDQRMVEAFPDIRFEILLTVAQGDYVAINWRVTGSHHGPLRTPSGVIIPPTGRPIVMHGSHTFEIRNRKVVRNWFFTDMVALLVQLGLMPSM